MSVANAQNVKKYPQLAEIAARVPKNTMLSIEAFRKHLEELDKSLRSVPATAQVPFGCLICAPQVFLNKSV